MKNFSRTTKEQWALDFGCDISEVVNTDCDHNETFEIKNWSTLSLFKNFIHSMKYNSRYREKIDLIKNEKRELVSELKSNKVYYFLLSPILIPLFFVFAIFFVFFLLASSFRFFNVIRKMKKDFDAGVVCGSVYKYDLNNHIYISKACPENIFEYVLSHEHIHLKQNKYRTEFLSLSVNESNFSVFSDKKEKSDILSYLLKPSELEARLHEVVKKIYELNGAIPNSKKEFFSIINHFKPYWVAANINLTNAEHELVYDFDVDKLYELNNPKEDDNFKLIFFCVNKKNHVDAFVLEILFPCYCNLVRYYGDEKLYQKLISEHVGPSRFDQFIASPELN